MADVPDGYVLFVIAMVFLLLLCILACAGSNDEEDRRPDQRPEQTVAQTLAEWEAMAARAEAALAERAAAAAAAPTAPPLPMPLPYFPYAGAGATETVVCSICLEPLRQWELCSEVPVCRHVFHRECLGQWARSSGTCPLCRAKIVPGSYGVDVADDMV